MDRYTAADVLAILLELVEHQQHLRRRHLAEIAHARAHRTTCLACGCLCWPWEHCPGCEARRQNRKDAA